ncbi:hypothetical protein JAAARDRAFT_194454 [Jaapia argillacea MUCL 33604]|uniref:Uncharacterized protein n=1 Tax=Jaapia argillacea MUCL 33604 TaxID=933084 RepID=A0A067PTY1_9AGAM|nr:hypothetical protein JAAARDRAFT_194454 [Jaapia argillacea MUCL 33604]
MSTEPVRALKRDRVGHEKEMTTEAALYRDGTLVANVFTDCDNDFHGLRGRVLIVALDGAGFAVGVSEVMRCTTRGGTLDIFTPSSGRETFIQKFPDDVAARVVSLDIYQAHDDNLGAVRNRAIGMARDVVAVAAIIL